MDEILKLFGGTDKIWGFIQKYAAQGGREATRTMLELFYVLKSPSTGLLDKTLIVAALGYQLLPEDALPRDKYGLLGFLDNGVTIAFAYNKVKSLVTPEINGQVNAIINNWFGDQQPSAPQFENGRDTVSFSPQPANWQNTSWQAPPTSGYSQPTTRQTSQPNNEEDVVID